MNPDDQKVLEEFLCNNDISCDNPINIETVIKHFSNDKIKSIFYLDLKSKVKLQEREVQRYFKTEDFQSVYILDVKDKDFYFFFETWEENCLIGTDIQSWKNGKYEEESKKLVSYHYPILNYEFLFDIFKEGKSDSIFKKYDLIKKINIAILNAKEEIKIQNLNIFKKAINVIFGPKASGKTTFLDAISKSLKDEKVGRFKLGEDIKNIEKDYDISADNEVNDICQEINDLLNYNEKDMLKEKLISNLKWSIENKNSEKIKILNYSLDEPKLDNKELNKGLKEINNLLSRVEEKINNFSNDERKNISDYKSKNDNIKWLLSSFRNDFFRTNKQHFEHFLLNHTMNIIKEIYKKHKKHHSSYSIFWPVFNIFKKKIIIRIIK